MSLKNITAELREKSFYYSLLLFVIVLPFSEAFVSIATVILLVQALLLNPLTALKESLRNNRSVFYILAIFGIYLLGMVHTKDVALSIYELKKVAFWLVIPLALVLSPKLSEKRFYSVLTAFCVAVTVVSFIAAIRFIFKATFNITDFRDISLISHIRYSYQIALTIFCCVFLILQRVKRNRFRLLIGTMAVWLVVFLFILKSMTGIIAFLGTVGFFGLYYLFSEKRKINYLLAVLLAILVVLPITYTKSIWDDFYAIEKLDPQHVDKYTESGNPYTFNFNSQEKENGHWVQSYICTEELRTEWNKLSECKFDSLNQHGFTYRSTLIRYLTSRGLRKDSVGVSKLTDADIKNVEQGIANYIYAEKRFSLYPRIYETIWEYDRYKASGNPNGQSLSQRIEFVKASLVLIKENFWLGIGTGNWKTEYAEAYKKIDSKLKEENQRSSHNQYLNYMVKFGIVGFVFIMCFLLIPVLKEGHRKNLLFWLLLVFMGIANFGDANFETHMGLSFFCFFYCLFLWHTPDEIKNFNFKPQK
ncbi:O-antigen ligase family protein [Draconibacterium sp. IB214405]|uniref:O-antigen ligase family protein n=1 Tax=Draconibacterium sp. IB214405 TaxID=3097352 RepID=UPI002A15AF53|nr:O-antigen ligase family protein [Draconibacterium sp. IB214405]MDX8338835.1 O-antigen ligase family protein [Draconibacterium sp. IB214405]